MRLIPSRGSCISGRVSAIQIARRRFIFDFAAVPRLAASGASEHAATRSDPELDALSVQLEQAPDAATAAPIEMAIRERWADSGSPTVNILLERADAAEREGDADLAARF